MGAPRLSTRIKQAGLAPAVARTFSDGLRAVIGEDPIEGTSRAALVERVLGALSSQAERPAPFEALWPHSELFLTACVTVAVTDGEYRVSEARQISHYAHRLGFSARQLAELESRVLRKIVERGAAVRRRDAARAAGAGIDAPEPGLGSVLDRETDDLEVTETGRTGDRS